MLPVANEHGQLLKVLRRHGDEYDERVHRAGGIRANEGQAWLVMRRVLAEYR